jgi:hypothetical protein
MLRLSMLGWLRGFNSGSFANRRIQLLGAGNDN